MADNETAEQATAVAEQEEEVEYVYSVKIEDVSQGVKKVSVEIPHDRIAAKIAEQFKDVRRQAAIPGFRAGHAPQKLIEKRFASDVREQVRSELVRESFSQAIEKNDLQVIGEPEFEDAEGIKLPESGALTYSFQVEVQPEVTLPPLDALTVKKPRFEIKEENIDQAMLNLRSQQGTLVPIEDRGVEAGDYLLADAHLKVDGNVVTHSHDAQLVARPGRIANLQIDDLDTQLQGLKLGETRSFTVHAPDTHPTEALRGKDVEIEVTLKSIKKLELAEVTPAFLEDLGFSEEATLRQALKEQMEEKLNSDVQQAMRTQVQDYLLTNTNVQVPDKLSDRQADRIVQRRAMNLMMRGMPQEQLAANIEQLRGGAREEAARELKLFFILQKLANEQNVDVDESELNGRVAMIAAQRDRRPEKLSAEMQKDGSLQALYVQMREEKAVDKVLQTVKVEEVELTEEQKQPEAQPEAQQ